MYATVFAPKPVVVGHRGLGGGTIGDHRENTIGSYLAAVEQGVNWIEVDVRRSADDKLVIHHDPSTRDDDVFVIDQTAEQLAAKGVITLSDVFDALPEHIGVNVDVKTELEDAVVSPSRRTGALLEPLLLREVRRRPLFACSFDPGLLLYLRDQVPGLPLGFISWVDFPIRHAIPAATHLGLQAICTHTGSLGPNRLETRPGVHRPLNYTVQVAHEAGLEVLAWCPGPEDAIRFAKAGVDAVCVNDVQRVLGVLGNGQSPSL